MITINKSLLCPVPDNSLTSVEVNNGIKSVNDAVDVLPNNSSFSHELTGVRNVNQTINAHFVADHFLQTKGLFAQEFLSVGPILCEHTVTNSVDTTQRSGLLRISQIVNDLLPKFDSSYQISRTVYENTDKANFLEEMSAQQVFSKASLQKENLQKEAMTLYVQHHPDLAGVLKNDAIESAVMEILPPFFTLIFNLSFSYDDVERLLDSTGIKNYFLEFAKDDRNQDQVSALFQILNVNSARSLENEMLLARDSAQ